MSYYKRKSYKPNFSRKLGGKIFKQQSSNTPFATKRGAMVNATVIRDRYHVQARVVKAQKGYWVLTRKPSERKSRARKSRR